MALGRSLSEILDECLSRVARGETVEACLADYPEYAIELRDELEAAVLFQGAFDFTPSADAKRAARLRMHEALDRKQTKKVSFRIPFPRSWFATGTRIATTAAVAVVAIVTSSTGTVWASQGSTPGDLLYPVKRTGEQVQLTFAFSDTREAELRDTLVERRMEELDQVTASGRERFVPDLVDEIIKHSTRAQVLAARPVEAIVATLPAIDAPPTREPVVGATPDGTPEPTPTARPAGRADKQVSVTPVLTLSGELELIDDRLRAIESEVLEESSRDELARLRKSLNQTRQQLNRLMNRADQVHNPDVVERPVDADEPPGDAIPTPTPTPDKPLAIDLGGRVTGSIQDVIFQQENGKLERVDVLVVLDADESLLLVQITREGTKLLKDGKGASVKLLRIDQQVVMSVDGAGEVLAMSILPKQPAKRSNENNDDARSSSGPGSSTPDGAIASSQGNSSNAGRSK
jgi:hypothetical protein